MENRRRPCTMPSIFDRNIDCTKHRSHLARIATIRQHHRLHESYINVPLSPSLINPPPKPMQPPASLRSYFHRFHPIVRLSICSFLSLPYNSFTCCSCYCPIPKQPLSYVASQHTAIHKHTGSTISSLF